MSARSPIGRSVLRTLAVAAICCSQIALLAQDARSLTPAQVASSRALAPRLSGLVPVKRPSLLVQPSDRSIFVEPNLVVDASGPKSLEEQIARATCAAEVVVVGTVSDASAFLTEDADFILTEYAVVVDEVLRGGRDILGKTIGYVRPGGSLLVNGRVVNATHNMYPRLDVAAQYLLFMTRVPGGSNTFRPAGDFMATLESLKVEKEGMLRSVGPQGRFGLTTGREPPVVRAHIAKAGCGR